MGNKRNIELLLALKRERKRLKRLRRKKVYRGSNSNINKHDSYQINIDSAIIDKHKFELDSFLDNFSTEKKLKDNTLILIPQDFSLEFQFKKTIETLDTIRKSVYLSFGQEIIINFERCTRTDFSALFLLKVLLEEYLGTLKTLNRKTKFHNVLPVIKIKKSKVDSVNLKLLANIIILESDVEENNFIPVSSTNYMVGRKTQKHYLENRKGLAITRIRNFINNECLSKHDFKLKEQAIGNFDGLLSEMLNNAEDHSEFDKWYVFGNLFETNQTQNSTEFVGEFNLAILNFGYSIYDGFEQSKENNLETYSVMESLYNKTISKSSAKDFTKENLFTLYALQEGISRLKYDSESRGTGTMKFINSFLNLGDYEDKNRGFNPRLNIYSGNTKIKCDNEYRPFTLDGSDYISLNKEKDLSLPPVKTHLETLKRSFPGTLLVAKIYFNEEHLKQKMK